VLGVYADYYVFETTLKEQPEEEEETLGAANVQIVAVARSTACVTSLHELCVMHILQWQACHAVCSPHLLHDCCYMEEGAAHWSCLTMVFKPQEQCNMFLQMSYSAAYFSVESSPGCQFYQLLLPSKLLSALFCKIAM